MKGSYFYYKRIPRSRIATFDTFDAGLHKHHISALLEFDVTESRRRLQESRRNGINISFNAWLVKVIGSALQKHPDTAAFLYNKRKLILFNAINVSLIIEKKVDEARVPIPVVIERANEKSALEITAEIEKARNAALSSDAMVIHQQSTFSEKLYYHLPQFLRMMAWKVILRNPRIAYKKMGNVVITSIGMIGRINGWFIHKSVHPVSFGIGSVIKKPVVMDDGIKIREILNMTILIDHDVVDGAPMVRFLNDLTKYIEKGEFIDYTKPDRTKGDKPGE